MFAYITMYMCRVKLVMSEVGLFSMCLKLLAAMLEENIEIGGELHIERLYLFCVMWSYGGLLEEKERKGFNDLLATLSTALGPFLCFKVKFTSNEKIFKYFLLFQVAR